MSTIRFLFAFCMATFLFSSCGPEVIFEKELEIPAGGWTYQDTLHYEFEIVDTSKIYNLFLDLAHTTAFASQNLYVKLYTGFPNGQRPAQRLSIDMADKTGAWLGNCSGEKCQLNIPIQSNAYFDQVGTYSFTVEQFMRMDSLPGIESAAFRIELAELER